MCWEVVSAKARETRRVHCTEYMVRLGLYSKISDEADALPLY
jgi:hypothetical protein